MLGMCAESPASDGRFVSTLLIFSKKELWSQSLESCFGVGNKLRRAKFNYSWNFARLIQRVRH